MTGFGRQRLRVAVLPADTGACGHLRLIWPADAVKVIRPGWDIKVYDPRMVKIERGARGLRVHGLDWRNTDVLVTQRVGSPVVAELCGFLRERGVAVVLDMDDAMWALDPDNTAYAAWNDMRGRTSPVHWSVIDQVARTADLVTVTTSLLAEHYGSHGRVEIIPNRIPRMAFKARRHVAARRTPVAGWAGLLATHPHDPKVLGDALRRTQGRVAAGVIGDAYRTGKMWGVKVIDFPTASLGMPYFRQLANFDIGMVPLDLVGSSAVFNAGKSSLKALEMAATGSAVVASPSPANVEFSREVPVRLAASPAQWVEHLTDLADPAVRSEQVEKQRAALEAGWVLQDRAVDWATAWEQAVINRQTSKEGVGE